jgi:hypothetical protein
MLKGRYRDIVTDRRGKPVAETSWRPNLVVDGAFALLAALLGRDDVDGILFWAVGEGAESWDRAQPTTVSATSRLVSELRRLEVPREAIRYLDGGGGESAEPTPDLEIRLTFEWPDESVTLREFGVFGGDATERPNSGTLINHVIHRSIVLEPGQRLTRQLRMSLGRAGDRRWLDVAAHWLGDAPVRVVDGVGDEYGDVLTGVGLTTVEALAFSDPAVQLAVPRVRLLELRSKARLALRTAVEIQPPERLHELTVSQVLRRPPAELAADVGVREDDVVRLREQLATIELTMDHTFLGRVTVGALAGNEEPDPGGVG